ncbi:MAG: hypothetical protein LUJ09_03220 [Firmicutes bacterium]|nr:hypothetical protein [Bacillota bacterium]
MKALVDSILTRYGTAITVRRVTGDFTVRGCVQHTGSLSRMNMQIVQSPVGQIPWSQYTMLLPAEPLLVEGDIFYVGETWYTVRRVEPVYCRDTLVGCWGICERRGEADNWGYPS